MDERYERFMEKAAAISAARLAAKVGREVDVLVDSVDGARPSPARRAMRRRSTAS